MFDHRMRPYEEIRQYSGAYSATAPIFHERFTCMKQCEPRYRRNCNSRFYQSCIEILRGEKAHRGFCINHIIDEQRSVPSGLVHMRHGPTPPNRIPREDVEQNVRVNEYHTLLTTRHCHDFVSGEPGIGNTD